MVAAAESHNKGCVLMQLYAATALLVAQLHRLPSCTCLVSDLLCSVLFLNLAGTTMPTYALILTSWLMQMLREQC
jgi:hypothetical protein